LESPEISTVSTLSAAKALQRAAVAELLKLPRRLRRAAIVELTRSL
jgi:hypothetical protein